ncbi:MAG: cytochrome C [Nitrospira sp.]|nr:cytochrome C [Nitrospira sp.]
MACYECHDKFTGKRLLHSPVEAGECTACHNPHGSPFKFMLKASGGDLCYECHDSDLTTAEYVHGPAAVGGCTACHDPHSSDYDMNLRLAGPGLCYSCHTDKAAKFLSANVIHKPVKEDCIKCHNPHSSPVKFMLKQEYPLLCLGCHEKKKEQVYGSKVMHSAVFEGKSCLNCHDPHASSLSMILSMPSMQLCLSCHDRERETEDGTLLVNIKALLQNNTEHHGPVKQEDCSGCHDPHGSDNFRILREPYPAAFYIPFNRESYNLCFSCHEESIVMSTLTTTLTGFRNGDMNLHFKHVNQVEKGRTCRACHETHASSFPKHIRESVPFGVWDLPLNYKKSDTGGSCMPGCHKLKIYDRNERFINP